MNLIQITRKIIITCEFYYKKSILYLLIHSINQSLTINHSKLNLNSNKYQQQLHTDILSQQNQNLCNLMSQVYSSQLKRQHEFFLTLKRYAQRLSEQKNISLSYLQTVNQLSQQLNQKNEMIQRLSKQNQDLKQKVNLYQQVMTRSRIIINSGGNMNLQNHNNMNVSLNTNVNGHMHHLSLSPNNYANMKFNRLIDKEKFTESFMETRNELQYLKEYDQEAYQKLESKIKTQKQFPIVDTLYKDAIKEQNFVESFVSSFKVFPVFDDFVILKPTQNMNSSPQNIGDMKLVFSLNNSPIKKGNKLFESISTYLCHNQGPSWTAQEYKTQIILSTASTSHSNKSMAPNCNNSLAVISSQSDDVFIYLSNSQQTLQPIIHSLDEQQAVSPIYLQFNPSLYYFGICYKSHCLQYINGKLHKVPLLYCFVTRYPFLCYWRELLELIVERLNIKNEKDMGIFRHELQLMREKSVHSQEGIIDNIDQDDVGSVEVNNLNFEFELLQKHITWKKITPKAQIHPITQSQKQYPMTSMKIVLPQPHQVKSYPVIPHLHTRAFNQNVIPQVVLYELAPIFASYNIELIIDVLLLLLLEIPIAVISKSESLLQKFMIYFVYIIKPLKYPFPIIFNLPLNMSVVLQSPFPSFLGLTDQQLIEPYMFERTVFDLDEKVAKSWPNIGFYNQSRECVVKWISKSIQNEVNQIAKLQRINQIVKMLISSSKKYPQELKQLRTYRKYFKKTEIWHLYSHSQQQKNDKN